MSQSIIKFWFYASFLLLYLISNVILNSFILYLRKKGFEFNYRLVYSIVSLAIFIVPVYLYKSKLRFLVYLINFILYLSVSIYLLIFGEMGAMLVIFTFPIALVSLITTFIAFRSKPLPNDLKNKTKNVGPINPDDFIIN